MNVNCLTYFSPFAYHGVDWLLHFSLLLMHFEEDSVSRQNNDLRCEERKKKKEIQKKNIEQWQPWEKESDMRAKENIN